MENILLPSKIELKEGKHKNHGIIEISPCYFGYGTTLGNALRRVLLSSLPGAAVTAVKIKGVSHEFSAIENVQEDVLEILLNFKRLRFKLFSDEPVKLHIKAKGNKKVTAADIEQNSDVEIISKDLHLATLTDDKADFDVEVYVEKGRGYVASEQRDKKDLEIGMMAVDSIFTPVVNVGFKVENVRVGQITDYDKLVLDIETDGTVSPKEALSSSAQILIDYFSLLVDEKEVKKEKKKAKKESSEKDITEEEAEEDEKVTKKKKK